MEILSALFYFIITIGVLVFVHEFGHFAAAKLCGMRVDRFSIGFPPRAFGKKFGDTDYCVSWIPIGGYVKIAGMIDESFDTDFLGKEPQPWEFRARPIWQRMIVISAGVIMNLLLAVVIFWGIIYFQGKTVWPTTDLGYVLDSSPAAKAGLKQGDRIVAINGAPVKYWEEIENFVYVENIGEDIVLTVERRGSILTLSLPRSEIPSVESARFGILPKDGVPVVAAVEQGKPASAIGLKPGDVILAINGLSVSYGSLQHTIRQFAAKEIDLEWRRGSEQMKARVTPTAEGRIGISLSFLYTGPVDRIHFSVLGALGEGFKDMVGATGLFFKNIKAIFAGRVSLSESVGGPVRIAQIASRSAQAGLASFLAVMAWLSLTLAILNLLPFPALDGGHLMFLVYEAIFRREIPPRVKIILQQAGFALLLVFMAFVIYNDIASF